MRIIYVGTGEIGLPSFKALLEHDAFEVVGLITQPDKPAGRKQALKSPATKALAMEYDVPVWQPERINHEEVLHEIAQLKPDLAIVCAYGQILKKEILHLPSLGCLNIHASLLPAYRGAACIQEALRQGDKKTGITIMWMDEGLDTGDILLSGELDILPDDTAGTLHDRLAEFAPEILITALLKIGDGTAPRIPQNNDQASYVGRLKKQSGRINWEKSAREICNHVRAMTPWPTAFTMIRAEDGSDKTLKLFDVILNDVDSTAAEPGQILVAEGNHLVISTGQGSIQVRALQIEGRKRMSTRDFLLGYSLKAGSHLDR
ncbi:MAG: methionyl-tRNA formyltransferase [Verrucomicrobiota bacterium]